MAEWKCEECGNTVEAPQEPEQCPCGSENITRVESGDKGFIGRIKSSLGM